MIVYVDILIVLNLIVDYFLLLATSKICRQKIKLWRILLGSGVGAISSLYIFLPQSTFLVELFLKLVICALMVLSSFGWGKLKMFLKKCGILFIVTCAYAGIMMALWHIFKPSNMVINNSVVYFNISPTILICATVVGYICFIISSHIFKRSAPKADRCEVLLFVGENSVKVDSILDTGNSIEDVFGKSEIIISDKKTAKKLFGNLDIDSNFELKRRYRIVPCGTVSGADVLEGFRLDSAVIFYNQNNFKLEAPVLAVSKFKLNEDYSAILNPKILDIVGAAK